MILFQNEELSEIFLKHDKKKTFLKFVMLYKYIYKNLYSSAEFSVSNYTLEMLAPHSLFEKNKSSEPQYLYFSTIYIMTSAIKSSWSSWQPE